MHLYDPSQTTIRVWEYCVIQCVQMRQSSCLKRPKVVYQTANMKTTKAQLQTEVRLVEPGAILIPQTKSKYLFFYSLINRVTRGLSILKRINQHHARTKLWHYDVAIKRVCVPRSRINLRFKFFIGNAKFCLHLNQAPLKYHHHSKTLEQHL